MSVTIMTAAALLAAASPPPEPGGDELFLDVWEGDAPEIDQYSISGSFGTRRFTLSLNTVSRDWAVRLAVPGRRATNVRFRSDRFPALRLDLIVVALRGNDVVNDPLIVAIPYGDPQTTCFANGGDVHPTLVIYYHVNGSIEITERTFRSCQANYRTPSVRRRGSDVYVIS